MSGKNGQNRPTHLWTYLDQEARISATHMLPTHKHTCCWRKVLLQPPPLEPCYLCTPLAKRRIGWEIWSLKGSRTFSPQRLEPRPRCITQRPQVWKPETRQPPVRHATAGKPFFGTHLQRLVCGFCRLWRCRVCFLLQPNAQITPAPIWKRLKQLRWGNCVSQNLNTQNLAKKRQKPQPPTLARRFCL